MRVLKSGATKAWGPQEVTCVWCKALLEVVRGDLIWWREKSDYGSDYDQVGVKCPECHNRTPVSVPSALHTAITR